MPERVTALILAAGEGTRLGTESPKQFLDLAGEPVIVHAIGAFDSVAQVGSIVVVVPEQWPAELKPAFRREKIVAVTSGGPTRQASLDRGLNCLPDEAEIVAVHDAARPLVRPSLVRLLLDSLNDETDGVVPVLSMDDAVKEVSIEGHILRSRSREILKRVQTPQVFHRLALEEALAKADAEGYLADDCSDLVTRNGGVVKTVVGDPHNLKITYADDLRLAEQILHSRNRA